MAPTTLWLRLFGVGCCVIVGLLGWSWATPPFEGDLTRTGRLSETAFQARLPHVERPAEAARHWPLNEADLVVIGDSFSLGRFWQAELVKAGHRVATLQWDDIGPLCGDFSDWLVRSGFRGRRVIIESAERELDIRLKASAACTTMHGPLRPAAATAPRPTQELFGPQVDRRETAHRLTLSTGAVTAFRTARARRTDTEFRVSDGGGVPVLVSPVPDGCRRFSHALCRKGLFLSLDLDRPALSRQTVQAMDDFSARQKALTLAWMVIPDKSTVYLAPQRSVPFAAEVERRGLGPDLFSFAILQSQTQRDFFQPNDTHLSMQGYAAVGGQMLRWLQRGPAESVRP